MIPIDIKEKNFNLLMNIYQEALDKVYDDLEKIREVINEIYGYNIINHITKRIKTPDSIIHKMKKKNYELNYKELIELDSKKLIIYAKLLNFLDNKISKLYQKQEKLG